ncbi:nickel pincer cofactor biosynthesis protein LarC [Nocardia sp. NPDC050713]|uniref:nickel pincer cofactor biosynthesis protein LarC n=1 Tax=Nocardia sp. NPDC050713 TaxID=3154511 RepID=UPI003403B9BC
MPSCRSVVSINAASSLGLVKNNRRIIICPRPLQWADIRRGEVVTTRLYLDCVGGAAGDMLLAALISAGADMERIASQLPRCGVTLRTERTERHGAGSTRVIVDTHADDHPHRHWSDIRQMIDSSAMRPRARQLAHAAFERLAHAEARVHGVTPEDVVFHEVGALDAIADICGVAIAVDELGIDQITCSPLPLGHGTTVGAHGVLPLPAPATLEMLRQVPVRGVEIDAETVTPTGAALITSMASSFGRCPEMRLLAVGSGAGTANFEAIPNIVRALVGESPNRIDEASTPLVLETNLDDLNPEFVPDVVAACLSAGASDVWTTPIVMKHGRPGVTLAAIVPPDAERSVAEAMFRHSTALGIRLRRSEHRWTLDRQFYSVEVDGHSVAVKIGILDGDIVNVKPEHRDCERVAEYTGRSVKSVWMTALSAAERLLPN